MSGRYLLDTNTIIYAINRKLKLPKAHYAVSVITKMELLSWPQLTQDDEQQLMAALAAIKVQHLTDEVQQMAVKIRRTTSLKLPDSIISATAINGGFVLVTDDDKLRTRHVGKSIKLEDLA